MIELKRRYYSKYISRIWVYGLEREQFFKEMEEVQKEYKKTSTMMVFGMYKTRITRRDFKQGWISEYRLAKWKERLEDFYLT